MFFLRTENAEFRRANSCNNSHHVNHITKAAISLLSITLALSNNCLNPLTHSLTCSSYTISHALTQNLQTHSSQFPIPNAIFPLWAQPSPCDWTTLWIRVSVHPPPRLVFKSNEDPSSLSLSLSLFLSLSLSLPPTPSPSLSLPRPSLSHPPSPLPFDLWPSKCQPIRAQCAGPRHKGLLGESVLMGRTKWPRRRGGHLFTP